MATRWNSKHTGKKIDDTIDYVTNPNLLDNWYFGNPVNQRGVSSGNGPTNAYGIDRWKFLNAGTLNIDSDAITIASDQHYYVLQQYIEPSKFAGAIGQTATLSALIKGTGRLQIALGVTGVYGDWVTSSDWTLVQMHGIVGSKDDYHIYVQAKQGAGNLSVKAVKLELGSQQTLAHKDAEGNWVLNEIPDYGEQLLRCQRYLFAPTVQTDSIYNLAIGVGTSTTTITFFLPLPTTMRAKSSITFSGLHAANEVNSMLAITKVANYGQVGNGVWLNATVASRAEVGKAYYLRTSNPWSLVLDSNL